jgi:hypothetical protein
MTCTQLTAPLRHLLNRLADTIGAPTAGVVGVLDGGESALNPRWE